MRMLALVLLGTLLAAAALQAHTDITPAEVKAMMDAGGPLTIVDVREESEFCDSTYSPPGHISGALNMTWYTGGLEENYSELPSDEDIVIVCRSGNRSNLAANFLDGLGFTRVFDMLGGMNAWPYETELCWQASVPGPGASLTGLAMGSPNPNPFNLETEILYTLPEGGGGVRIEIYDARGRLVKSITNGTAVAGSHRAVWTGTDDEDQAVPSGVYFSRLTWRGESLTRRLVLAK